MRGNYEGFRLYSGHQDLEDKLAKDCRTIEERSKQDKGDVAGRKAQALEGTRWEQYLHAVDKLSHQTVLVVGGGILFQQKIRVEKVERGSVENCFVLVSRNGNGIMERFSVTPQMTVRVEETFSAHAR